MIFRTLQESGRKTILPTTSKTTTLISQS